MVTQKVKQHSPFIVERRDCLITFPEDHMFAGAEIRARLDVDIQTFLQFQTMTEASNAKEMADVFKQFGEEIVLEWNLHDEDAKAVPPTADGFMSLPPSICTAIIGAWAEQAGSSGKA
tara:strand:+ start:3743 stop:4096 length:354 start_codon:yes stop_codon:yes gene_type:complete